MGNPFVHVELNTDDTGKAKKFYKALFDWKLEDMKSGQGEYTMVDVGKNKTGVGGGMMLKPMAQTPNHWLSYVEVADIKKTLAKAAKLGAQIYLDTMDIGMGKIGVFADPSGAVLGVWQPAPPAPKKAAAPAKKAAAPAKKAAAPAKKAAAKKKR